MRLVLFSGTLSGRNRRGLRRQSAAATALSGGRDAIESEESFVRAKSGMALRFPPQSKTRPSLRYGGRARRSVRAGVVNQDASVPIAAGRGLPTLPISVTASLL